MTYQPRANPASRARRNITIVSAIIFVVAALLIGGTRIGDGISGALSYALKPILSGRTSVEANIGSLSLKSKDELVKENGALTIELAKAEANLEDLSQLKLQNENLKNMLGRAGDKKLVLAAILSKPNQSPYDTVLIDIGSNKNLTPGMLVVAYGNIPIGRIAEVYSNSSLVRLLSSPGEETPILIGSQNIETSAKGQGGGNFLILLPKDTEVKEGDIVRLSGLDPNVIGRIEKIETSDTDTFARILFKSSVNLYNLSEVFIVSN